MIARITPLAVGLLLTTLQPWASEPCVQYVPRPVTGPTVEPEHCPAEAYWVLFTDKGPEATSSAVRRLRDGMTPHRARRLALRAPNFAPGYVDLPVWEDYVARVEVTDAVIRARSRWLNGVSVQASRAALAECARLPFVRAVVPLRRYPAREPAPTTPLDISMARAMSDDLDYGPSLEQNSQIQATLLHALGFTGAGVRIGVLDSGFNWRDHPATSSRTVVSEYDFVDDDPDPSGPAGAHGTRVFSVIAGLAPGALIGPAHGAEYLLARTEDISTEEPFEEDLFVAGLEWCEAMGADIITASLGYIDWYIQDDLDGQSTVTAQGCNIAAERGILVLTAAGNSGPGSPSLLTPTDSPGVLSVGAVNASGAVVNFSSRGPTADGRIKPDVMARGSSVVAVNAGTPGSYSQGSGTSFATPLAAGVAALLLEARPTLTAEQMRILMRATATRSETPDIHYGWGIVQGHTALQRQVPDDFPMPDLDFDNDFVRNDQEVFPGDGQRSNAWLPDSDGDGLIDGHEDANRNGIHDPGETHPVRVDSDGDGAEDGVEVLLLGTDPLDPAQPALVIDADGDGLPASLDPDDGQRDVDGDRIDDGYEALMLGLAAVSDAGATPRLGDVSDDGVVGNLDALIVQAMFLRLQPPDAFHYDRGDLNRDGDVTNLDMLVVQAFFLGAVTLPIR